MSDKIEISNQYNNQLNRINEYLNNAHGIDRPQLYTDSKFYKYIETVKQTKPMNIPIVAGRDTTEFDTENKPNVDLSSDKYELLDEDIDYGNEIRKNNNYLTVKHQQCDSVLCFECKKSKKNIISGRTFEIIEPVVKVENSLSSLSLIKELFYTSDLLSNIKYFTTGTLIGFSACYYLL